MEMFEMVKSMAIKIGLMPFLEIEYNDIRWLIIQ